MSTVTMPDAVRADFNTWLNSDDNKNRTRFDEERYLDYKSFLTFPDSKLPHDLNHDKDAKQKWSNRKCDSLTNYELVKGAVYRKPMGKYIERYNICFIL